MSLEPRVAMEALGELARQADELDGKRRILAAALLEIRDIANDGHQDNGVETLSRILYIISTGGVQEAMKDVE